MYTELQAAPALRRYSLNGQTMGTRYSALCFATALDQAAVAAALFAAVDRVDRQMSNWKPDSDLSRLNAAPVGEWVPVPKELATVLAVSLRIGRASGSAFDIGLGDLVNAWGFGPAGRRRTAAQAGALAAQPRRATVEIVDLDRGGGRIRKLAPVALDLCGIAKGFGVDELARCLEGFGITSYLVGIDGEMRARGRKPDGTAWAVAIERPDYDRRDALGVMALADMAIATSGDYRHWVEFDGSRLSHTMSSRMAGPVRNRVAAVTVLAETCMEADAWATALMVLGEDAGPALARARRLDALFVLREHDGLSERAVGIFDAGA